MDTNKKEPEKSSKSITTLYPKQYVFHKCNRISNDVNADVIINDFKTSLNDHQELIDFFKTHTPLHAPMQPYNHGP